MRAAPILLATVLAGSTPAAPTAQDHSGLPVIGPAPDFVLRAQDGAEVALNKFRGKAVAVTFIFASCSATCPILIAKMAAVRDQLGSDFGPKIAFLSITVESRYPEGAATPRGHLRRQSNWLEISYRVPRGDPGHRAPIWRIRRRERGREG